MGEETGGRRTVCAIELDHLEWGMGPRLSSAVMPIGSARIFCRSPEECCAYLLAAGPMDQGCSIES